MSFSVVGETSILPDQFSTNYESIVAFGKAAEVYDDEKHKVLCEFIKSTHKVTGSKG